MKRLLKNKLLWVVLAMVFALGTHRIMQGSSPSANQGTVTREDLLQRVTVAGNVIPNHKTLITAPYSGYVRKIFVQVGDRVKEGDPVVSVAQSLKGSGEEAYPLRAPFAGTVVQVLKTEGEYIEQSGSANSIVRIDDLTHLFVEANSPEIEVGKLQVGQEAMIKAAAILDRSFKGKIMHISLAAKEQKDWDRSKVEFPILIEVEDKSDALKPGMSVVVDVVTKKLNQVLTLKHEFIQKEKDQYFVTSESGTKKKIEVGLQNEDSFEIKSGLSEGEKVRQTDFLMVLSQ